MNTFKRIFFTTLHIYSFINFTFQILQSSSKKILSIPRRGDPCKSCSSSKKHSLRINERTRITWNRNEPRVKRDLVLSRLSSPPDFRTGKRKKIDPISLACNQAARGTKSAALSATDIQLGPRKNHNRPVESIPYSSAAIEGIKADKSWIQGWIAIETWGYDSMIPFIKRHPPPPPPIRVSHVPQCSTCIIDSPSFYFPSIKELLLVEPWQRKRVYYLVGFFLFFLQWTPLFSLKTHFLTPQISTKGKNVSQNLYETFRWIIRRIWIPSNWSAEIFFKKFVESTHLWTFFSPPLWRARVLKVLN